MPDLGEELALGRLNQMCEDVRAIYPLGAQVWLATDGLVFDDVVGIPDEDTWAYSEGLMQIAQVRGYAENIKLFRAMDILGYTAGRKLDWALYSSLVQQCRDELLANYGRTEEEVRTMMKDDTDTLLTYCGFIRFLESDLKYSKIASDATSGHKFRKCVKKVAIQMMIRAEVCPYPMNPVNRYCRTQNLADTNPVLHEAPPSKMRRPRPPLHPPLHRRRQTFRPPHPHGHRRISSHALAQQHRPRPRWLLQNRPQ